MDLAAQENATKANVAPLPLPSFTSSSSSSSTTTTTTTSSGIVGIVSHKRKRVEGGGGGGGGVVGGGEEEEAKRMKKRLKRKKERSEMLAKKLDGGEGIQYKSPSDQLAYFWAKYQKVMAKEDGFKRRVAPDETAFIPPIKGKKSWNVGFLPQYLKSKVKAVRTGKMTKGKGTPYVMISCRSAGRGTEIRNALHSLGGHIRVALFFAKHKKISEQIEILQESYLHIVIGTPERLRQLQEEGSLNCKYLDVFLIDMDRDMKNYSILDNNDTNKALLKLYDASVAKQVLKGTTQVMLF